MVISLLRTGFNFTLLFLQVIDHYFGYNVLMHNVYSV